MNNADKLINFLKENNHRYVLDVLHWFNQIEEHRISGSDKFDKNDYVKLKEETGLSANDMLRFVKFYDVLKKHNLLDGIIGVGDDVSHADEAVADALYCMNTLNFMWAFKEAYTKEQMDDAILDPSYDPATGFRPQYEASI